MTENEIDAIIRLLDDPDKSVYQAVKEKIISEGESMIPALENAWASNEANKLMQKRIEKIVPTLESNAMTEKFKNWTLTPDNLIEGAWLMSRLQNFSLSHDDFMNRINELKKHLYQYGFNNYSPLEHIKIMNYIFFRKMGFKPCKPEDFTNPNTCFPACVMDTKTGNPETLAIIYLIMAREAGLPIAGVNLPKNFILAYSDSNTGVKFYINPTTNGAIFNKMEIDNFLSSLNIPKQPDFYRPCSNTTTIVRALMRLEFSYRQSRQDSMADRIHRILESIPYQLDKKIDWI